MADSPKASAYQALRAGIGADGERWSVPQAAMLVTVASAGLWALLLLGLRWLLGS